MKNEINAVLENMTTTIPEPEDYTGEDGLLYCGKCRKPKEAYFAPDKAAIFGRDRHPAECDCQRAAREERDAPSPLPDDMRCLPFGGRSGWYRGMECSPLTEMSGAFFIAGRRK